MFSYLKNGHTCAHAISIKYQIPYYPLLSGFYNLQHFVVDFARLLVGQFTIKEVMSYEFPPDVNVNFR